MADATPHPARFSKVGKQRGVTAAVVTALAVALAASGCGSSSHSSSTATTANSTSSSSSNGASSGLARAQAAVKTAEATPSKILQTTPLKSKPPAGKTIVVMNNEISQSQVINQGVQAAANAVGWKVKALNWMTADPTTLVTAMKQALQYHPVSVTFGGPTEAVWGSEIPSYKSGSSCMDVGEIGRKCQ